MNVTPERLRELRTWLVLAVQCACDFMAPGGDVSCDEETLEWRFAWSRELSEEESQRVELYIRTFFPTVHAGPPP